MASLSPPIDAPLTNASVSSTSNNMAPQNSAHEENTTATPQQNGVDMLASSESSKLSSIPSKLLPTPDELKEISSLQESERVGATRDGSPLRRSQRKRKQSSHLADRESSTATPEPRKKRKLSNTPVRNRSRSSTVVSSLETPPSTALSRSAALSQNSQISDQTTLRASSNDVFTKSPSQKVSNYITIPTSSVRDDPSPPSKRPSPPRSKKFQSVEQEIISSFLSKLKNQPSQPRFSKAEISQFFDSQLPASDNQTHEERKNDEMYPAFDRQAPTFYQSDGFTKTASSNAEQPNSTQGSEAPSPSRKGAKPSGGKRPPSNKGKPKSRASGGGAGGGRDRDRDRDSPEPPNRTALSQEDKATLAHLRARQAELKKFFALIAAQQREALETLASRDLTKLSRKQKAHRKVPEYDEVVHGLARQEDDVRSVINAEYDMQVTAAEQDLKAQRHIVDSRFNLRVAEAQKEHVRGAKGDLTIFANAHRAANDSTWTEHGSDVESYFPRYHELPEPDAHVRGYTSSRIIDEKSFKEHLARYDEQAQRDVIEDDILEPVRQSVAEQNALRQAGEAEKSKMNIDELVLVAEEELRKASGYLIPRPLYASENPQFALSRLADCADYIAKMHPDKNYVFMPVASRDIPDFPRNFLERVPPQTSTERSSATAQPEPLSATTPRKIVPKKQKSISLPSKRPKEEDSQSQSSSNNSTPLPVPLPAIAPAPAPTRMPPPPVSAPQHYQLSQGQMPPSSLPPPPTTISLPRPPPLTPLIIPKPQTSPEIPAYGPQRLVPNQVPPPPSPGAFRPAPSPSQFGPPLPPSPLQRFPGHYSGPGLHPPYHEQPPRMPGYTRAPPPSPSDPTPSMQSQQNRFAIPGYGRSRTPRPGGSRRNSGQITFTQTYTPSSARFKPSPSPLTATTPSNSALPPLMAPQQQQQQQNPASAPLQPGPPPPPPSQAQISNNNGELITRPATSPMTAPVGRMVKEFGNPQIDSKTLADTARQNAARAQGQGAGPKGGKRVLLPKAL